MDPTFQVYFQILFHLYIPSISQFLFFMSYYFAVMMTEYFATNFKHKSCSLKKLRFLSTWSLAAALHVLLKRLDFVIFSIKYSVTGVLILFIDAFNMKVTIVFILHLSVQIEGYEFMSKKTWPCNFTFWKAFLPNDKVSSIF